MSSFVMRKRVFPLSRLMTSVAAAMLLAGCSGGVERFSEPFFTAGTDNQREIIKGEVSQSTYDGDVTGSASSYAPTRVASQPLPPVSNSALGSSTYGQSASAEPARSAYQEPVRTASIEPRATAQPVQQRASSANAVSHRGWSSSGGTSVSVQQGDTAYSISRRYGVPVESLLAVNNINDPSSLQAGQSVTIPAYVYNANNPADSVSGSEKRVASRGTGGSVRGVPNAVTAALAKPQRKPATGFQVQRTAQRSDTAPIRVATSSVPSSKPSGLRGPTPLAARSGAEPARRVLEKKPTKIVTATPDKKALDKRSATRVASLETDGGVRNDAGQIAATGQVGEAGRKFRWPVNGRIVSSFGSKPGGEHNDGINLAVPEGTPVRAAEDGTVIYSGNELKGYGNLVLVRHDEGWVSAYAHNKDLTVRRGDIVRRGDVVAKAGSTGSVDQPQLHFELRKGNKPINPVQYLPKS